MKNGEEGWERVRLALQPLKEKTLNLGKPYYLID